MKLTCGAILLVLTLSSKGLGTHSFHPVSVSSVSPPRSSNNNINNSKRVSNSAFATTPTAAGTTTTTTTSLQMGGQCSLIGALRGGAALETATGAITTALRSGPLGVLALTAIASAVVTPLTLYRQAYSFSVGYGFSVFAMGLALLSVFGTTLTTTVTSSSSICSSAPLLLVASILFYGFRLGSFLLIRQLTVLSKQKQLKSFDKTPLLKRIPLAVSVSMFYAFMVTPALYLCRAASTRTLSGRVNSIASAGAALAWIGALMEAVADTQKYLAKRNKDGSTDFVGPTTGLYAISRHPNYFGEVVFWFGVLVSGAPTFVGTTISSAIIIPLACSLLGFVGIYKIMTGATDRLDKKQEENYGGQQLYDDWKNQVPNKLAPTTIKSLLPLSLLVGGAAAVMKVVQLLAAAAGA